MSLPLPLGYRCCYLLLFVLCVLCISNLNRTNNQCHVDYRGFACPPKSWALRTDFNSFDLRVVKTKILQKESQTKNVFLPHDPSFYLLDDTLWILPHALLFVTTRRAPMHAFFRNLVNCCVHYTIDCSNFAEFFFLHLHSVDLRSRRYLCRCLGNRSIEGAALLGIGEVLTLKNFSFPVLLDESEDRDRIVFVCGTVDHSGHSCGLRRGTCQCLTTLILYKGTNVGDNLPWRLNHFVNIDLGVGISLRA